MPIIVINMFTPNPTNFLPPKNLLNQQQKNENMICINKNSSTRNQIKRISALSNNKITPPNVLIYQNTKDKHINPLIPRKRKRTGLNCNSPSSPRNDNIIDVSRELMPPKRFSTKKICTQTNITNHTTA